MSSASLDEAPLGFLLVILAGLSTAIGAAAVFEKRVVKLASKPVLAAGLGFSGGVMIYVSFVEIFGKSNGAFVDDGKDENWAYVCATICFFSGMLLMKIISFLVHLIDKDHNCACDGDVIDEAREISVNVPPLTSNAESGQQQGQEGMEQPPAAMQEAASPENAQDAEMKKAQQGREQADARKLQKMGINTAAAIAIHNFPEGLATFVATLMEPSVGVTLAIAIGIHNIPEGLCVALPIYYATDSRLKGFLLALFSGISEPIGALIGYAIIKSTGDDMNQMVYGILFGIVGGMMVMIVISELLPTAYRYDPKDRFVTNSVILGMVVMAASLCLFLA